MLIRFSRKQKDFPKWEIQQISWAAWNELAHMMAMAFMSKISESEYIELGSLNSDKTKFLLYGRQNVKMVSTVIMAQDSKAIITRLTDSNETNWDILTRLAFKYWNCVVLVFRPNDELIDTTIEEDLQKVTFTKKEGSRNTSLAVSIMCNVYKVQEQYSRL